jgi:PAS domain S-box-containing protein
MNHDVLLQTLQSDLLANILEYAADIKKCSENITVQVREMIGARVVALLTTDPDREYRLLAACPRRRGEIFSDKEIRQLVAHAGGLTKATLIEPGQGELGLILAKSGMKESFVVPLRVGEESFGMLLLLDLMDTQGIQKILDALRAVAGLLSLVFKQSFLYHNMESLVVQRTRALQESEEKFRTVASYIHDWEYWTALDGSLVYISPSCERITGYTAEEFSQDPGLLFRIIHPDDRDDFIRHREKHAFDMTDNDCQAQDFCILTRNGEERWISHVCREVFDRKGKSMGRRVSNRDITERKKAEREKEIIQAQLIQAQKMEAIGTLAGGIAHDFNNILGVILGYAEMAREDCLPGSVIAGDLDQVVLAGKRAKDLVKQILAFSRQAETERVPLQPATMVKEAIRLLRSSLPTTILIQQEIDPDCNLILADPTQIHQILMNLGRIGKN